jgi:hypothetical protein
VVLTGVDFKEVNMPSPGDEMNLVPNLTSLGNLPLHGAGAKLGYNATTIRFYVDKGDLLQGVRRTVAGDSVLSDKSFGRPVREVFAAAVRRMEGDEQMADRITSALRGLEFLRDTTYADDDCKVRTVQGVINDALYGFRLEPRGFVGFRARHRKFLVYGFSQGMFIEKSSKGICYGFTIDWARRVLWSAKPSYAHSDRRAVGTPAPLTLNMTEKVRMMRKVLVRIRPLQEAHLAAWEDRPTCPPERILDEDHPLYPRLSNLVTEVWDTVKFGIKEPGHLVMDKILESARDAANKWNVGYDVVFLLEFGGNLTEGHSVACRLLPHDAVRFFDPNIGEFLFPSGSDKPRSVFWDDWWSGLYRTRALVKSGDLYKECRVRGVVRPHEGQRLETVRRADRRKAYVSDDD